MAKLKPADILEIGAEEEEKETPREPLRQRRRRAEKAAEGKPSEYVADLRAKLRDRVVLNLGDMPRFIVDAFAQMAAEKGMNKREFFCHLLREQGADIPPYKEMDGRKL